MITVHQLSKCFRIYDRPLDRLHDWLMPVRRRRGREFWALQGLDFAIEEGASVGLVGVNGAGKSTLLKILTGTMDPTLGSYEVKGRVASLLELGTGFHPDFTGRQNLQMNGKLAGLTDDELAGRMDAIIEFAELGDFIDQPVRTYSSGMALRLGFALASSVDPDVLIIDEALSVGDLHFQQKCLARIKQFHERGVTVLFVSHDPGMVQRFCTEALLLDGGRLIERGKPSDVLDYYTALLAEKHRSGGGRARILKPGEHGGPQASSGAVAAAGSTGGLDPVTAATDELIATVAGETPWGGFALPVFAPRGHRTGNFRAVLTHAYLRALDDDAPPTTLVTSGQPARLVLRWAALEPIDTLTVGIMVRDRLGQEMYGVNTAYLGAASGPHAAGEGGEVEIVCTFNLGPGLYSLTAALHTGETHTQECYDWVEQALAFQVLPDPREKFTGLVRLQPTVRQHACPPTPETLAAARQRLAATPDAR